LVLPAVGREYAALIQNEERATRSKVARSFESGDLRS
jgi:hypothetical protein